MARPVRTARLRRLHARRRALSRAELLAALTDGDPLSVAPLTQRAWAAHALLAPPALLYARALERIAAGFQAAPRSTPWTLWLTRRVDEAAAALRGEDARRWRIEPTLATPFEQAVASCFGVSDDLAAELIGRFHGLEEEDRHAVHALLPRPLFGLEPLDQRARTPRAREDARRGIAALRRLVAELRARN